MIWSMILLAMAALAGEQRLPSEAATRLEARIALLEEGIRARDAAAMLAVLPPPLVASLRARFGVSEEELREQFGAAMTAALSVVELRAFGMSVPRATVHVTPDGQRQYLLVPTVTKMKSAVLGRMTARSSTLAFEDAGEWYLIRVADAEQIAVLREVYPEFAGVEFPADR